MFTLLHVCIFYTMDNTRDGRNTDGLNCMQEARAWHVRALRSHYIILYVIAPS